MSACTCTYCISSCALLLSNCAWATHNRAHFSAQAGWKRWLSLVAHLLAARTRSGVLPSVARRTPSNPRPSAIEQLRHLVGGIALGIQPDVYWITSQAPQQSVRVPQMRAGRRMARRQRAGRLHMRRCCAPCKPAARPEAQRAASAPIATVKATMLKEAPQWADKKAWKPRARPLWRGSGRRCAARQPERGRSQTGRLRTAWMQVLRARRSSWSRPGLLRLLRQPSAGTARPSTWAPPGASAWSRILDGAPLRGPELPDLATTSSRSSACTERCCFSMKRFLLTPDHKRQSR